ncbi:hypothetical protein [Rhizobium sp. BK538]|nr:hypothetical protein [Rhizobium sp. BK538]MBB4166272.1 hypothetical protein [Rhizobium sp. BK538]
MATPPTAAKDAAGQIVMIHRLPNRRIDAADKSTATRGTHLDSVERRNYL